jgi:RHS repeat-associated protein
MPVISDKVIPHQNGTTVDYFLADIRQSTDYSPFGVTLQGRNFTASGVDGFRYGYQGSEMDDELKGDGNSYTTEYRQLDPRLGRWLSIDPKASSFPWQSPYCSMDNNPIFLNDKLGLEAGDLDRKQLKAARKFEKKLNKNGFDRNATQEEILSVWEKVKNKNWAWVKQIKNDKKANSNVSTFYRADDCFSLMIYKPDPVEMNRSVQTEWSPGNINFIDNFPDIPNNSNSNISFVVRNLLPPNARKIRGVVTVYRITDNVDDLGNDTPNELITAYDDAGNDFFMQVIPTKINGRSDYESGNFAKGTFNGTSKTIVVNSSLDNTHEGLIFCTYYLVRLDFTFEAVPSRPCLIGYTKSDFHATERSKRKFIKQINK